VDTQTRIGVGAGAAFAVAGIAAALIGSGWLAALTLPLLVIAIWGLWPMLPMVQAVGLPFGYIPLHRAAANLYGKMRGTAAAEFAERSASSPAEVLNWFAYWMVLHGVRVFGKPPPSTRFEEIPRTHIEGRLHFDQGATTLVENYNANPVFTDLSVRRSDLFKRRTQLQGERV
jgi:hypothetical protein